MPPPRTEEQEAELQRQKAAAFDSVFDELFLDESTGLYSAFKPLSSAMLSNIRSVVVSVRPEPGAEGSHNEVLPLANDGTAPEADGPAGVDPDPDAG